MSSTDSICDDCNVWEEECDCSNYNKPQNGPLTLIRWMLWVLIKNYDYTGSKLDWEHMIKNFNRLLPPKHVSVIFLDVIAMGQVEAVKCFAKAGLNAFKAYDYDLNPPIFGLLQNNRNDLKKQDDLKEIFKSLFDGFSTYHMGQLSGLMNGYDNQFRGKVCNADHFTIHERNQTLLQLALEQYDGKEFPFLYYLLNEVKYPVSSSYKNWTPLHEAVLIGDEYIIEKLLRKNVDPFTKGSRVVRIKDSKSLYTKYFKNKTICEKCGLTMEMCVNGDLSINLIQEW